KIPPHPTRSAKLRHADQPTHPAGTMQTPVAGGARADRHATNRPTKPRYDTPKFTAQPAPHPVGPGLGARGAGPGGSAARGERGGAGGCAPRAPAPPPPPRATTPPAAPPPTRHARTAPAGAGPATSTARWSPSWRPAR